MGRQNAQLRRTVVQALFFGALMCLRFTDMSALAQARITENYPAAPVKVIVPKAPGGPVDTFARLLATQLEKHWKQPVVVDDRAGAGGTIGTAAVAKAVPDGYTLLVTDVTSQVTAPLLMQPRPYDSVADFEPVVLAARSLLVLVINNDLPVRNLNDLVTYGRSHAGELNYSSAATGGFAHLTMALLLNRLGLSMQHVPYRGGAPALLAAVTGEVQMNIADLASALPQMRAGKVRPLVQIGVTRSPLLSDVPTVTEAGVRDFDGTYWLGVLAPPGTPKAIVEKLNSDVNEALHAPEIREYATKSGTELAGGSPETFKQVIRVDQRTWSAVIRDNNIRAE
ncbi:MAG TPA: tripartite tricarboxylate transporter substrate binding protein [Burkholderiales bacterium]|nr:tripartite tricarboxylate transporter substrate binding protein [Burkholderiales bacterium]